MPFAPRNCLAILLLTGTLTANADQDAIPPTEYDALVKFFGDTGGASGMWSDKTGWLMSRNPDNWHGVTIRGGHVDSLMLTKNELAGNLGTAFIGLRHLRILNLSNNHLRGAIPKEIGQLQDLEVLSLSSNLLEGEIPEALYSLPRLKYIALGGNLLSGTISDRVKKLTKLEFLGLSYNSFAGPIPPSLGDIQPLSSLELEGNFFDGRLPDALLRPGLMVRIEGNALLPPKDGRALDSIAAVGLGSQRFTSSDLPRLITEAREGRGFERAFALRGLSRLMPTPEAVTCVIENLNSDDPMVAKCAAEAAGSFGPAAAPCLPKLLILVKQSPHQKVRRAAVDAIGRIGSARGVEPLRDALNDGDQPVRMAAAVSLARLGAVDDALPMLKRGIILLSGADAAVEGLGIAGVSNNESAMLLGQVISDNLHPARRDALRAAQALGANVAPIAPMLTRCMTDRDEYLGQLGSGQLSVRASVRTYALQALENIPSSNDSVSSSRRALSDDTAEVREVAARILRDAGPKALIARTELIECSESSEWRVRIAAAGALAAIGEKAAAHPVMSNALADPRPYIKLRALMEAAELGDQGKEFVPELLKMAGSDDVLIHPSNAEAVLWLAPSKCRVLRRHLRSYVLLTLGNIARDSGEVRQMLRQASSDPDAEIRQSADTALAKQWQ